MIIIDILFKDEACELARNKTGCCGYFCTTEQIDGHIIITKQNLKAFNVNNSLQVDSKGENSLIFRNVNMRIENHALTIVGGE